MDRYMVFGSVLESEIPFPDLPRESASGEPPRWRIEERNELPPMVHATVVGTELLYADVHARLLVHRDGWRIIVDDTGAFELGREHVILVQRNPEVWDGLVRGHLLGRVLATMYYRGGWLPLHGSAVATAQGTIAFLGPKGIGKTTLAAALVRNGAPLVTDDLLPVEPGVPPRAWPGVRTLRLREDALKLLSLPNSSALQRDGKAVVPLAPPTEEVPAPLAALYVLAPRAPSAGGAIGVERERFGTVAATAAVTAHVSCGALLGSAAAGSMLPRVAGIVQSIPVYRLSLPRDLTRLSEVADKLVSWQ